MTLDSCTKMWNCNTVEMAVFHEVQCTLREMAVRVFGITWWICGKLPTSKPVGTIENLPWNEWLYVIDCIIDSWWWRKVPNVQLGGLLWMFLWGSTLCLQAWYCHVTMICCVKVVPFSSTDVAAKGSWLAYLICSQNVCVTF